MDYKNILEGTRPFFQGLPSQSPGPPGAPPPLMLSLPLPSPGPLPGSQENNSQHQRSKYEEGLGATLSQMYSTGSPTLRTPSSSSSPKTGHALSVVNNSSSSHSPGNNIHLTLRGGSSSSAHSLPTAALSNHSGGTNSVSSNGTRLSLPTMVVRRESPLDLSVKTVRQSADSSTNNNNPLEPSSSQQQQPPFSGSTASNCVNSTGGPSLSSSGASTPNQSSGPGPLNSTSSGSNNVSNIIAAVANSTTPATGRDREQKEFKTSSSGRAGGHNDRMNGPVTPRAQSPAAYPQSHHLFGHYAQAPGATAAPSPAPPKSYHPHYLPPTGGSGGFRQAPGMPHGSGSHLSLNSVPTSSSNSSAAPTSTLAVQQQPSSRPASVIPPYNPPPPNFGLASYHHSQQPQQQGQAQATNLHHPGYHPAYSTYHAQSPASSHHPYYAAYAHAHSHSGLPQISQSQGSTATAPASITSSGGSSSNCQNGGNQRGPGAQTVPVTTALHYPQSLPSAQSGAGKGAQTSLSIPQHYGLAQTGPPNASSQYHHYPQYFPQHHAQAQSNQPAQPPALQAPPRSSQSQVPQPAAPQQRHHPLTGYPPTHYGNPPGAHNLPPSMYSSGQQQHYPSPNPPTPTPPSYLPSIYSHYHHSANPPRGQSSSTNPPTSSYPPPAHYPSHLAGPRPQAPPQQQAQPGPYTAGLPHNSVSASLPAPGKHSQLPAQVPTHAASPISAKPRPSSGGGRSAKTGEKRKSVLDILRNSVETRMHDKQEKEKFQFNHQTWNFHGRKYHNPLPPPLQPGKDGLGPGSGSGSIVTGQSSNNGVVREEGVSNGGISVPYPPGLFGIGQRSNFVHGSDPRSSMSASVFQGLDPEAGDSASSMNRIRTKAEKKQVFPNLLSQIEQENSTKHQTQIMMGQVGFNHAGNPPTSVFDFQDDEEDSKSNLNLSRSRTVTPGSCGSILGPSASSPPKRKSGSKKFTSKLNKWIPEKEAPNSKDLPTNSSFAVSSMSSTSAAPILSSIPGLPLEGPNRVPALDNDDEFWSTCDSFLSDLTANPMAIKSRRGGLWAKLKPKSKEKEPGTSLTSSAKGRRVRRNSTEEDADFQVEEEKSEVEDEDAEGNSEEEETDDSSDDSKSAVSRNSRESLALKKGKNSPSSSSPKKGTKRRNSASSGSEPKPKHRKGGRLKGTKVGKRTLRKRRANLLGDLDGEVGGEEGRKSSDGSESEQSSGDVESFSISESSGSDSEASDSDSDSSESGSEVSEEESGKDSEKDEDELSLDSTGKKVKSKGKVRNGGSSRRGRGKKKLRTRSGSLRHGKDGRRTKDKGKKEAESKGRKMGRKLRPKRTCAKGKLKDMSGSEEEHGSSGEEWIMRGELGKRKREKRRTVFGDGSDFRRPGWEEELIDFKKKLRMPSKLIRVAKPSSLSSSSPSGRGREKDSDYVPAGTVKDEPASSPAKSTKENKSPSKSSPAPPAAEEVSEPKRKPKGRPPKAIKTEEDRPKGTKKGGKSDNSSKPELLNPEPVPVDKGKGKGKGKGKRSKSADKGAKTEPLPVKEVKEEREPGMLPTPGPAGAKFNKKMSIKSVFGVDVTPAGSPVPPTKKILRRNKFKSGFDYIRKKKKAAPPTPDGSVAPPPPKRPKVSQEKNMTEEDVLNELKGWVLNKGLGETALHRAARLGYPDVAAYSLEHDVCSPNCKDNAGYSPLHETCMRGNLEVAKILLLYGANPSQAAPGGIRPLHEACENGHVELVRLLISYGADPLLATYAGQTPIELSEPHQPVKSLLEQHIKDVQGKDERTWEFRGTGGWAEKDFDNGYDATASPPPPSHEQADGFEFESTELPLPIIYMLKENTPYIFLQDFLSYVGLTREQILKIHPESDIVELNPNDFLEEAHCCHLFGVKFRLNTSSDLLTLIKYDDTIKQMLNIETHLIK